MGIVKFKFKHQNVFDKIEFPSSEITVAELRIKIQEKLMLTEGHYKNASILQIFKYGTDEVYELDHELIPSQTSVIIARMPKSKQQQTIVVDKTDAFGGNASEPANDYFALKPSIIQGELEAVRRVPSVVVCELCNWLMLREISRHPVILQCCGATVCADCARKGNETCPMENRDLGKKLHFVTNRAVERLVQVVSSYKSDYVFDCVKVPESFLELVPDVDSGAGAQEVEVVDVDDFEPEVFDVDNPRPLTGKELEAIERREKRKRKALEILAKREGKTAVKGELTEADINRLLKMELKAEISDNVLGGFADEDETEGVDTRPVLVEFPKLLSPEEFMKWQSQHV